MLNQPLNKISTSHHKLQFNLKQFKKETKIQRQKDIKKSELKKIKIVIFYTDLIMQGLKLSSLSP